MNLKFQVLSGFFILSTAPYLYGQVQLPVNHSPTPSQNEKESTVPAPAYSEMGSYSEGMAWVEVGNKYGFANRTGKLVIPAVYDEVGDFSEALAFAQSGGRNGFIDPQGRWVIKPQFGKIVFGFKKGFAWVYDKDDQDGKLLVIDRTGKTVNTLEDSTFNGFPPGPKKAVGSLIERMDCHGSPSECHEIWYNRKGEVVFERIITHYLPKGTEEEIIEPDKRPPSQRPAVMEFSKNKKWGLKGRNDQILVEPVYESVDVLGNEANLDNSAAIIEESNDDGDFTKGFIVTWKDGKTIQTPADEKQIAEFERKWTSEH